MRPARIAGPAACIVALLGVAACADDGPVGDTTSARGAEVYEVSCASCHGADLGGTAAGPPLLSELYALEVFDDDAMRASITEGAPQRHWDFGPMASVGAVRGSDIDAVIAFVREQQVANPLEPPPSD